MSEQHRGSKHLPMARRVLVDVNALTKQKSKTKRRSEELARTATKPCTAMCVHGGWVVVAPPREMLQRLEDVQREREAPRRRTSSGVEAGAEPAGVVERGVVVRAASVSVATGARRASCFSAAAFFFQLCGFAFEKQVHCGTVYCLVP